MLKIIWVKVTYYFLKSYSEYTAPVKKSAFPGTDEPASDREPDLMSSAIQAGSFLPLPTSIREPTIALTIFLRNLFARILNTM